MLAPFFVAVIYALAYFFRNRYIPIDDPTRRYFIRGLTVKLIGSFAVASIYWFYYGDGDTIWYYRYVSDWRDLIDQRPDIGFKLFFHNLYENNRELSYYLRYIRAHDPPYTMVVKLATFASLFVFRSYIGIAIIFSFVCYIGLWLLYRVFCHIYPAYYRQFAYSILYVPSVVFWGSGLFKDTITMGCVAWAVYNVYRVFINPSNRILNAAMLVLNVYLIMEIKNYIVACLLPFLFIWVVLERKKTIKSNLIRKAITPFLLAGAIAGAAIMPQKVGLDMATFEKRAEDMVWWHTRVKELYGEKGGGGSHYTIGDPTDFSPAGVLKKAPLAVNVTFFRPYIWETRSPVVLISAFESLGVMILFLYVFMKLGLGMFTRILREPFLIFCFGFAILFSIGVGLTSSNFGALVRYKIPAMPFFVSTLIILILDQRKRKKAKMEVETIPEKQEPEPVLSTS